MKRSIIRDPVDERYQHAIVTLTVTLPGTGQTDSPLAKLEVEEETDRFLKTVAKHYGACYVYLITW